MVSSSVPLFKIVETQCPTARLLGLCLSFTVYCQAKVIFKALKVKFCQNKIMLDPLHIKIIKYAQNIQKRHLKLSILYGNCVTCSSFQISFTIWPLKELIRESR